MKEWVAEYETSKNKWIVFLQSWSKHMYYYYNGYPYPTYAGSSISGPRMEPEELETCIDFLVECAKEWKEELPSWELPSEEFRIRNVKTNEIIPVSLFTL